MKKKLQNCIKSSFFTLAISLIVTLWVSSFFEIIFKIFSGLPASKILISFGYTLLADIESVLLIGILLYPFYYLFGYFKQFLAQMTVHIMFSLLVIIQFALAKYQFTNLVNLGADFFGFSLENMNINVSSTEVVSIIYFIPFMFIPISYIIIEKYLSRLSIFINRGISGQTTPQMLIRFRADLIE